MAPPSVRSSSSSSPVSMYLLVISKLQEHTDELAEVIHWRQGRQATENHPKGILTLSAWSQRSVTEDSWSWCLSKVHSSSSMRLSPPATRSSTSPPLRSSYMIASRLTAGWETWVTASRSRRWEMARSKSSPISHFPAGISSTCECEQAPSDCTYLDLTGTFVGPRNFLRSINCGTGYAWFLPRRVSMSCGSIMWSMMSRKKRTIRVW